MLLSQRDWHCVDQCAFYISRVTAASASDAVYVVASGLIVALVKHLSMFRGGAGCFCIGIDCC